MIVRVWGSMICHCRRRRIRDMWGGLRRMCRMKRQFRSYYMNRRQQCNTIIINYSRNQFYSQQHNPASSPKSDQWALLNLIKTAQQTPLKTIRWVICKQGNSCKFEVLISTRQCSCVDISLGVWNRLWKKSIVRMKVREWCGVIRGVRRCWWCLGSGKGSELFGWFLEGVFY